MVPRVLFRRRVMGLGCAFLFAPALGAVAHETAPLFPEPGLVFPAKLQPEGFELADFDSDGILDALFHDESAPRLGVALATPTLELEPLLFSDLAASPKHAV